MQSILTTSDFCQQTYNKGPKPYQLKQNNFKVLKKHVTKYFRCQLVTMVSPYHLVIDEEEVFRGPRPIDLDFCTMQFCIPYVACA